MNDGNGSYQSEHISIRKNLLGIVERNDQSYWTRIGTAFSNRDGSWTLLFDYFPSRGEVKIQMREPLPPRELAEPRVDARVS